MEIGKIYQSSTLTIEPVAKSGETKDNALEVKQAEKLTKEDNQDTAEKELKDSIDKLNKFLEGQGTHIEYERHDKLNQMMVKIIDNQTKEVVKEIPPKKILDLVAKMCELAGILVDKQA